MVGASIGIQGALLCVAFAVHGREWYAATIDLQVRLVLQIQLATDATGNSLGKSDHGIMVNGIAALDRRSNGRNGAKSECDELSERCHGGPVSE